MEWLNYLLAFVEGLALILSPCILPILPILLSGSLTGSKKRPLGIICGFSLIFSLVTLGSHFLVQHLHLNLDLLRDMAFLLIICFGLVLVSDYLSEKFSVWTSKMASSANRLEMRTSGQGFGSGFILGSLISLIWTPCAGPILAAALVQIATQKNLISSFIALFAFALGSVLPMVLLALAGRKALQKMGFLKKNSQLVRKICGYFIIISAISLLAISHYNPNFFANLALAKTPQTLTNPSINAQGLTNALVNPYPAPPIAGISAWINSPPLQIKDLKNKVVLLDFWTYSCINCLRTLPYLLAWDKNYRDKGLVIIGIHTPEFEFEKNLKNVKAAVKRNKILYPVALDNNYATWLNYHNQYWPAHYLIDQSGNVVYQHFGEGNEEVTENNIRRLLNINQANISAATPRKFAAFSQTPETYLGYERMSSFASLESVAENTTAAYTIPEHLPLNSWALKGDWLIEGQRIISKAKNNEIVLHFNSAHVYVVAGSTQQVVLPVLYNGKALTTDAGNDVKNSSLTIQEQRLYEIANFPKAVSGEIRLIVPTANVEFYTFTFG